MRKPWLALVLFPVLGATLAAQQQQPPPPPAGAAQQGQAGQAGQPPQGRGGGRGAQTPEQYAAFVDAVARGIGSRQAIVILEPDGLGLIPQTVTGGAPVCDPAPPDGGHSDSANSRFALLNGAVDRLAQQPGARVYLDGTHSAWLAVGDISMRLVRAGVQRADGFFVRRIAFWTLTSPTRLRLFSESWRNT